MTRTTLALALTNPAPGAVVLDTTRVHLLPGGGTLALDLLLDGARLVVEGVPVDAPAPPTPGFVALREGPVVSTREIALLPRGAEGPSALGVLDLAITAVRVRTGADGRVVVDLQLALDAVVEVIGAGGVLHWTSGAGARSREVAFDRAELTPRVAQLDAAAVPLAIGAPEAPRYAAAA